MKAQKQGVHVDISREFLFRRGIQPLQSECIFVAMYFFEMLMEQCCIGRESKMFSFHIQKTGGYMVNYAGRRERRSGELDEETPAGSVSKENWTRKTNRPEAVNKKTGREIIPTGAVSKGGAEHVLIYRIQERSE